MITMKEKQFYVTDVGYQYDMINTIPCMANQFKAYYGGSLHLEDLSLLAYASAPMRIDKMQINGKEYEDAYFGEVDISLWAQDFRSRKFWR